jgi:hypothetical protein
VEFSIGFQIDLLDLSLWNKSVQDDTHTLGVSIRRDPAGSHSARAGRFFRNFDSKLSRHEKFRKDMLRPCLALTEKRGKIFFSPFFSTISKPMTHLLSEGGEKWKKRHETK